MEARTKRLVISVTPTEKQLLSKLAEYEGRLSLTATVRHILLEAARRRGLLPPVDGCAQGQEMAQ